MFQMFVPSLQLWGVPGCTLAWEAQHGFWPGKSQGRRSWPGTASLSLETFVHWHRKPSVRRPHHVTAIIMPILPADHVPGPPWSLALPSPFQRAAFPLGSQPVPRAWLRSSLPSGCGRVVKAVTPEKVATPLPACPSALPQARSEVLYPPVPGLLSLVPQLAPLETHGGWGAALEGDLECGPDEPLM